MIEQDAKPQTGTQLHEKNLQMPQMARSPSQATAIPLRINADDESGCVILLYILTIVLPLMVGLISVTTALPNAMEFLAQGHQLEGTNLKSCPDYVQFQNGNTNYLSCFNTFSAATNSPGVYIRRITRLNQMLLFHLNLQPFAMAQNNDGVFNQEVKFSLFVAHLEPDTGKIKVGQQISSQLFQINENYDNLKRDRILLGVESKVTVDEQFFWQITFRSSSAITSTSQFHLETETVRQNFTIYTIVLRVIYFILSLIMFIRYTMLMVKIPKGRTSIEQTFIHFFAASTLLFNDQIYFVTILWPNPVTSFASAFFVWNFFSSLFALWALFLMRIHYQQPQTEIIQAQLPHRLVPFAIFYLSGLIFTITYSIVQTEQHPIITPNNSDKPFLKFIFVLTVICFVLMFFYIMYLFYLAHNKQSKAYRHSLFIYLSIFFVFAVTVIIIMGVLDIFVYSSALLMFSFTIANVYSFLLQYLYSPTPSQLRQLEGKGDVEERYLEDPDADGVDIDLTMHLNQEDIRQTESSRSSGMKHQMRKRRRRQMLAQIQQQNSTQKDNSVQTKQKLNKDQEIELPPANKQYSQFDIEQSQS